MSTLWTLVRKDLLRDVRHPWGLIVFMSIPVLTALLMAMVFSPRGDMRENVIIELAVLDRDEDVISSVLRSMSRQGDAAENLRIHFVESEQEGIRMLERRKASAFLVLPEGLTVDLLDGRPTRLTLYKNPAQAILPRVVEEGLLVVCSGVSQALRLVRPEMQAVRDMFEREGLPSGQEVALVGSNSVDRLQAVQTYLFPPLVQFVTVDAAEYAPPTDPADPADPADPTDPVDPVPEPPTP